MIDYDAISSVTYVIDYRPPAIVRVISHIVHPLSRPSSRYVMLTDTSGKLHRERLSKFIEDLELMPPAVAGRYEKAILNNLETDDTEPVNME